MIIRERQVERLANSGWNPCEVARNGQIWMGDGARALEVERSAVKAWDDRDGPENGGKDRTPARTREPGKKARLSSLSTSSRTSGTSDSPQWNQLPTPTKSTQTSSPEQVVIPLTPGYPESPTAPQMGMLPSMDGKGLGSPVTASASRSGGRAMKGRTRSMNALGNQAPRETHSERSGSGTGGKHMNGVVNGVSGSGTSLHKSGRGKGTGSSGSGRRGASGDGGGAIPIVNGTGNGRIGGNPDQKQTEERWRSLRTSV